MNTKEAINITRDFIRNKNKITPLSADDWYFTMLDNKVSIHSDTEDIHLFYSSSEEFMKNTFFNNKVKLNGNEVSGRYFFTSTGLYTEDDYYNACDIIDISAEQVLKEIELELGRTYISDKNKKYVYIGKLKQIFVFEDTDHFNKEVEETDSLVYFIEGNRFINLSSINLITKGKKINRNILFSDIKIGANVSKTSSLLNSYSFFYDKKAYIKLITDVDNMGFEEWNTGGRNITAMKSYFYLKFKNFIQDDSKNRLDFVRFDNILDRVV